MKQVSEWLHAFSISKINEKNNISGVNSTNTNNKLTEKFYEMGGFLYNGFSSIIDKINGKIKNNEINNESEDLDKIINDFLEENNSN